MWDGQKTAFFAQAIRPHSSMGHLRSQLAWRKGIEHGGKSEIRISKSETNSKFEFSNVPNENLRTNFSLSRFGHLNFDHSDLFRARPAEFSNADQPKAGFHRASASDFEFDIQSVL